MPSLGELKNKWFIPMDGTDPDGVPTRRHSEDAGENTLAVSTDGNTVTPLIDGRAYMRVWHDSVVALHGGASAELFHAGWRYESVKTLGETAGPPDALDDVNNADTAGVTCYVLTCRNVIVMAFNNVSVAWLRLHGVWTACMDNRFPPGGSNHQKFAVFKTSADAIAVLGSIDISKTRWDTPAHSHVDPDRNPTYGKPTHDTGVEVHGPAVADIEKTYRERWNDSSRTFGLEPLLPPQPLITSPISAPAGGGSHSVQVLRTYGITSTFFGYSWSPRGEFTVWASYLNAIKRASTYIYIEDQYFLPFDWPPCYSRTGVARDTDLIFQLGEAMQRGVRVAVTTPSNAEDATHRFQKYQRDVGVNYLNGIKAAGAPGDIVVGSLQNGTSDVYVHSKLMIVDDEVVLIGSTNVGQRSMTYDGELHVAVVDAAETLPKEFRKSLWAEHMAVAAGGLDDPVVAYGLFQAAVAGSTGHLKPYPVDPLNVYPATPGSNPPPRGHVTSIRTIVDPYGGPPGLR